MRTIVVVLMLLFLALGIPDLCLALDGPAETVSKAIETLQSDANSGDAVNYIYWQKVYKDVNPIEKRLLNANSPDELKSAVRQIITNPSVELKKRVVGYKNSLPQEQQLMLGPVVEQLGESLVANATRIKATVKRATYKVVDSYINEHNATVVLSLVANGKTTSNKIFLEQVKQRWLITGAKISPLLFPKTNPLSPLTSAANH